MTDPKGPSQPPKSFFYTHEGQAHQFYKFLASSEKAKAIFDANQTERDEKAKLN